MRSKILAALRLGHEVGRQLKQTALFPFLLHNSLPINSDHTWSMLGDHILNLVATEQSLHEIFGPMFDVQVGALP